MKNNDCKNSANNIYFLKNNIQLYWYQNLNKKLKNSIDKMAVTVYNKAIKNK